MSRYIDADELIVFGFDNPDDDHLFEFVPKEFIDNAPTADVVEVVHGEWIEDWEIGCSDCSHCGKGYLWEDYKGVADFKYCPHCGARMDGEK